MAIISDQLGRITVVIDLCNRFMYRYETKRCVK